MMKVSNRDKKLLFVLAGLLVFILLYLLVFTRVQAMTASVNQTNLQLRQQLDELELHYQNLATYEDSIETYRKTVGKTLATYPSDIKEEDILSYLLTMESREGITLESVSFSDPALITEFSGIMEQDDTDTVVAMSAYRKDTVMTAEMTYPQLKRVIDYLYGSEQQTALDSVSVSYNSEKNMLVGNFALSKFFVQWPGAEYYPEPLPSVSQGIQDLFATTSPVSVLP